MPLIVKGIHQLTIAVTNPLKRVPREA